MAIVIGVDPGTIDLGACIFGDGQLLNVFRLHVPQSWALHRRMVSLIAQLADATNKRIGLVDPVSFAIEKPIYMQGGGGRGGAPRTGRPILSLWMFYGALLYWAAHQSYQIFEYEVPDIKDAIGGSTKASKEDVEETIRARYPSLQGPFTDHEFDALAVATYHLDQLQIAEASITGDPRA